MLDTPAQSQKGKDPYRYALHVAAIAQVMLHPQLDNLMWLFMFLYLSGHSRCRYDAEGGTAVVDNTEQAVS